MEYLGVVERVQVVSRALTVTGRLPNEIVRVSCMGQDRTEDSEKIPAHNYDLILPARSFQIAFGSIQDVLVTPDMLRCSIGSIFYGI